MPLKIEGPFNTITVSLPWEQPPLVIPVAGGGSLEISLAPLVASRLSRFHIVGMAEVIARAGVMRGAWLAIQSVATAEGRAGMIRGALVQVLGAADVLPRPGVKRGAAVDIAGAADVEAVAGVKRGARVQVVGGAVVVAIVHPGWDIVAGDASATVISFPPVPATPPWDITAGDGDAQINTYPGQAA